MLSLSCPATATQWKKGVSGRALPSLGTWIALPARLHEAGVQSQQSTVGQCVQKRSATLHVHACCFFLFPLLPPFPRALWRGAVGRCCCCHSVFESCRDELHVAAPEAPDDTQGFSNKRVERGERQQDGGRTWELLALARCLPACNDCNDCAAHHATEQACSECIDPRCRSASACL